MGHINQVLQGRAPLLVTVAAGLMLSVQLSYASEEISMNDSTAVSNANSLLTQRQQAIVPVAACAATGDIVCLNRVLNEGLDGGMTISDAKEVLIQLYAYAGFPRSLNALGELMNVVKDREAKGIKDSPGDEPSRSAPQGDSLLAAGKSNQTKLSGGEVKGPLFEFAPVANEYLRTHLFGDIFERDNLDWKSREIATVAMLASMTGVEPQLSAHIRIAYNAGVTQAGLSQVSQILTSHVDPAAGQRVSDAIKQHAANR